VDKLLFPSVDECYVRITDNDIVTIERKYPYASDSQLIETFTLSPFRMHNSSKEIFSKNQEEIKIFSKLKLDINIYALRCIKSIINNEDLYIFLLKKIYESFEFNNILSKSSNIGLQKIKKNPFFITNHFNEITKILGNETLRKFFIRRIRDYIKYIKKNKNDLLVKFEQQEEKEAIFIKEFLEKKQPPFEFSNGGEKKHYQSHSLDFLNFIISKKIIILICRELMKESEDYLKIVFQFKKYPNYYLELKRALSLL
jgi:hypothetical protein